MYKKFINSFMALSALTAFTNLQAVPGIQQNLSSSLTLNAASALTVSGDLAFSGTYYAGSNIPAATTSNVATITSTYDGAATGSTPVGQSVVVTGDANSINTTSGSFQLFTTTGGTVSGTIPLSLESCLPIYLHLVCVLAMPSDTNLVPVLSASQHFNTNVSNKVQCCKYSLLIDGNCQQNSGRYKALLRNGKSCITAS